MTRHTASILALVLGCGGDDATGTDASQDMDATTLDADETPLFECSVLTDPDQCWNRYARQLGDCTPSEVGVLDADRTECTYSDGTTVQFAMPVPTSGDFRPNFTIRNGDGETCGSFSAGSFTVAVIDVGEGSASFDQSQTATRASVSCLVEGAATEVVFDATFSELTSCASGAEPIFPPGYNALYGASTVTIQIVAEGDNDPEPVVDCAQE